MTNPEELRNRFERSPRRLRWIAVLGFLVMVLLAIPAARPTWRAIKNWRATQFLDQAEELLAENQVALAFERARAALQLVPQRPDAMRLNARILGSIGSESSLLVWKRLIESSQASNSDLEDYLEATLGFERTDLSEHAVHALTQFPSPGDRDHRLLALYRLQTGRPELALAPARAAYQQAPSNPTNALLLASLLATDPSPNARHDARQVLWSLADSVLPQRIEALFRLTQPELGTRADRERVVEQLTPITNRSAAEEVLLTEALMLLNPADAGSLISEALGHMPREDWEHLTLLSEALLRRGHPGEVLRITASGKSLINRRLFLARYEALLAAGRPDEAYRHLLHTSAPLPPFDLELIRVRGAQEAGDLKGRDAHLRGLLDIAADHPIRIRKVAEIAESSNTSDALQVSKDAWSKLAARNDANAAEAFRRLQRLADRQGDTWTARDFAKKAVRLQSNDASLQLDIAHYSLLLDEDLERSLRIAENQAATQTNDFSARAVAALGHLRLGDPSKARAMLDRLILPEAASADALAIVVATLGANGLEARARELARQIPMTTLRPEERELIRPWIVPAPLGTVGSDPRFH
ncbi:MAG: hypothetical protein IT581_11270 [Verrucomicrobiales bacterium]|nr:hypothetical protein [Verrucomicrobiales bacterium]